MVECLLAHGADPNVKDHHGMTPLKMAKLSKKEPLVNLLVSHGAQG
jgi:ankyrin repeat protein